MFGTGARSRVVLLAVLIVFALAVAGAAQAQDSPPVTEMHGLVGSCGQASIEATNAGQEISKAVVLFFGEDESAGPLMVECGGLIGEGETWTFNGERSPQGAVSADVYSFTAKLLSELGIDLGFDGVVADLMCETLMFGVVGDRDDYKQFKTAYGSGDDWMGFPLRLTYGAHLEVTAGPALCTSHLPLTVRGQ